jgi:alpha-1,2-mannosyltransferase
MHIQTRSQLVGRFRPIDGKWPLKHWAILTGSVLAAALLLGVLAYYQRNASYMDFRAYYFGAQAITRGERLYEPGLAWRDTGYTQFFPGQEAPTENGTYIYPPAASLAFVALTALPFRLAANLWLLAIFGCLLGAAYVLSGLLFQARGWYRLTFTLGVAAVGVLCHASRVQLGLGQADFVVLLLMTLMLAASARGHDTRAGIWLALAAALKPTTAFLVLWFLWKRSYRAAAVFCGLSAALLLLPLAVFGPGTISDFIAVAQYFSGPTFAVTPINQSPYGLLLRLFTVNPFTVPIANAPALVDLGRYSLMVISLVLLARTVSRSRNLPATQLALEYGLLTESMLIVGPLSEDIHYVYLLVPFGAVAAALLSKWEWSRAHLARAAILLASYAYLSLPGMVELFFAFDMRVPVPIAGPRLVLTGAMLYGLVAVTVLTAMTLRWYSGRIGSRTTDQPAVTFRAWGGPRLTRTPKAVSQISR